MDGLKAREQRRGGGAARAVAVVLALIVCLAGAPMAYAAPAGKPDTSADAASVVREAPFAEGGMVIVDVNVGEVEVRPSPDAGKLKLVLTPRGTADKAEVATWLREFSVNGSQAKIIVKTPSHKQGHPDYAAVLYVPKHSDLKLNLGVGDLTVNLIAGNVDAEVGVGDLKMLMTDPHDFKAIELSVHVGDVHASVFGVEPSGFLGKSVDREFKSGLYRLRLHTGVGDVKCDAASSD